MRNILLPLFISALSISGFAQQKPVIYDESQVPSYELPDVLTCNDGTKVTNKRMWEKKRRPEVMEMFQGQMFGRTPKDKIKVDCTLLQEKKDAVYGKATIQQIQMRFSNGSKTHDALLMLVIPNNRPHKKVPVIFCYNFKGNHNTTHDPSILMPYSYDIIPSAYGEKGERGLSARRWDYEQAMDRGYAVATMCYNDIYPDDKNELKNSVGTLFSGYNPNAELAPDSWQSIGTWAWGASRVADYLQTLPWVDKDKLVMMGHSRLGKTSLWAGAQDTRFKVVISNDSGCGGAAISRRTFGETLEIITRVFPHWFCPSFRRFANKENELPFDQHELIALIAPRAVYVASAEMDAWADQKGEFLSAYHATPVYHLYGFKGVESDQMPGLHQPIMGEKVGYHIRQGVHDVTNYDWARYMDFCDRQFYPKK